MHTTHELLDLAKERLAKKHALELPMTDYRLAKIMGLKLQTLSAWRTGIRHIGTEFAARFAEACDLPAPYVLACIEHEREKEPSVRAIFEQIAHSFGGKIARHGRKVAMFTLLASAGITGISVPTPAPAASLEVPRLYIMSNRRRRSGRWDKTLRLPPPTLTFPQTERRHHRRRRNPVTAPPRESAQ